MEDRALERQREEDLARDYGMFKDIHVKPK